MNILLSCIIAIICSVHLLGTLSSRVCPHHCICYKHADLVDCRDGRFQHVPRGLPHGTWLLDFNQLVSVGPGVFRGLSRLRQLYLHNNRLTVVEQGSLDMLPGLEVNTANDVCHYLGVLLEMEIGF
uniref:LRRNT domain-containing protein n=1 Tax=Fundulus heteroclitus TaxID=8078 RepID=A0A3Q2QH28_FUNHE